MKFYNRLKTAKTPKKRKKIVPLSLYCITLALVCQVFSGIFDSFTSSASATNMTTVTHPTDTDRFYFQDFSADYYLSKAEDGTSRLKVIEKFVVVFPSSNQNHGITRIIPYTNQNGKNLTMASDRELDIQVKHNGIIEEPYRTEPGNGYFTVYIGDPDVYVHNRQIYELEYEFQNVITNQNVTCTGADCPSVSQFQELYWDTNGNDWSQRFDNLTARVHLVGDEVQAAFNGDVSCYVGQYGDNNTERCQVTAKDNSIEFHAKDLTAHENLTFALGFDADTFTVPGRVYDYRLVGIVVVEVIAASALLIMILTIHAQTKVKRAYYHGLFVTPEYTPPKDFTVAEMAANYVGQKMLGSSKVATLMELAVTRKVELSKVGTEKKPQWIVKILSVDLSSEQADVLKLLAGRDASLKVGQEILIKTHTSSNALVRLGQKYSQHIEERLHAKGLYPPQATTRRGKAPKTKTNLCDVLLGCGILWTIASFIALPLVVDSDIPSYITLFGGGWLIATVVILAILIAVGAFWASSHYQKFYTRTEDGLKWSRYLDGLRLYIKMAEQDRIKFLQSVKGADVSNQGIINLYEKLLPYAVIFRLETSWLNEMGKYYEMKDVATPTWIVGSTAFSAHEFSNAMRSVSTAATMSNLASHSGTSGSSSGSSGGGGGGFSGGGGGGGGGGGW